MITMQTTDESQDNNSATSVARARAALLVQRRVQVDVSRHSKGALPQVHTALIDVALLDGRQCAAALSASYKDWLDRVARGDAPQPVIKQHRFTRWRAVDVREYIERLSGVIQG